MVYEYEVTKEVSDALIDATLLTPEGIKQLRMYRIRCLIGALLFICLIPLVNNFIFTIMMLIAAAFVILFTIFATRSDIFCNASFIVPEKNGTPSTVAVRL